VSRPLARVYFQTAFLCATKFFFGIKKMMIRDSSSIAILVYGDNSTSLLDHGDSSDPTTRYCGF
jgi:hypothetical protein